MLFFPVIQETELQEVNCSSKDKEFQGLTQVADPKTSVLN